jgi:predicted component of type VI protein secretion system
MLKVVVARGEQAGQAFDLRGPDLLIGRAAGSNVTLRGQGISREHARLRWGSPTSEGAPGWYLLDLGTTNGTAINGQRIPAHQPRRLSPGDRIAIGDVVLVVDQATAPASPVAAAPVGVAPEPPSPSLGLRIGAALLFVLILAGIVAALVALLEPAPQADIPPTAINPVEQLTTLVPTEFQDIIPTIGSLIPTGIPGLQPRRTATPEPQSLRHSPATGQRTWTAGPVPAPAVAVPEPPTHRKAAIP